MLKFAVIVVGCLLFFCGSGVAQQVSPNGVTTLSPAGAIKPTGTWNLGTRAGDFIFVAGMRGIDPKTDTLVQGDEPRVRQAFLNMKQIAESEGAALQDAVRLVVFVTDMYGFRPLVNKVQSELWGQGPYPPRTIIEVDRLNQDDIVEVGELFTRRASGRRAAPRRPVNRPARSRIWPRSSVSLPRIPDTSRRPRPNESDYSVSSRTGGARSASSLRGHRLGSAFWRRSSRQVRNC